VSAPAALPVPFGARLVAVGRAAEMRDAVRDECRDAEALVMAAAVADYQPVTTAGQKIKRHAPSLTLELERTPDVLAEAGEGFLKVGFAAESEELLANARRKLEAKGLDLIVANDITAEGSGFGSDTNRVTILDRKGGEERLPLLTKYEVAQRLWDRIVPLLPKRRRRR
jgi:phosphopantothenoylcysteine decarboxylase/phosphopantothenate--cysteine ligase